MPPRRAAAAAAAAAIKNDEDTEEEILTLPEPLHDAPIEPSPVKTKFPTARIKRIMQADEEVGKVAQQAPIAVGKALELFMVALVSKSADVARERGQKRITTAMMKQVIETDDQWDFLRDISAKVDTEEKPSRAGRAPKQEASDTEDENPEPKKRGRGRKKKVV
ncbi:DNA polymerase epsilon subunit C [Ceratocystis platani]|uniref:DNA polymerase epsilon subunit C n=3 Tax=Ceratocystis TaxID=5157 RepID=A0A0F8B2Q0_CERFI|nr:DNA polymerase epsilon subunit C [Ceratocystis platani]